MKSLDNIIDEFAKLPGIGRKSAMRIAFHVLEMEDEELLNFITILKEEKEKITEAIAKDLAEIFAKGGKALIAGNGGSNCDALHFAEEFTGRFRGNRKALPAIAISDSSHITCVGNDFGFDYIFSRGVEAYGKEGDLFIGISTSGNSANIYLLRCC